MGFPTSVDVARKLQEEGIHTTLIPDSGVGYFMHKVNLVAIHSISNE